MIEDRLLVWKFRGGSRYALRAIYEKYADAETLIFWYRPEGSQDYRVICGDLSVKDVAPEDLPK